MLVFAISQSQGQQSRDRLFIALVLFKHLGLWDVKDRPPPRADAPPKAPEYSIDYMDSQLPVSDNLSRVSRSKEWLYFEPEYPEV